MEFYHCQLSDKSCFKLTLSDSHASLTFEKTPATVAFLRKTEDLSMEQKWALPISSHRILKRHVPKGRDLTRILITLSRTCLNETFFF